MAGQGGLNIQLADFILLVTVGLGAAPIALSTHGASQRRTADPFVGPARGITRISRGASLVPQVDGRAQ
jgi:hypothetical protein